MSVEMRNLSHSYGRKRALSDVTCCIGPGVTGLVGVNGAGKSTVLKILSGEVVPTSGSVEILGRQGTDARKIRSEVGVMPQAATLPAEVRVSDFMAYMAWLKGVDRSRRREVVRKALDLADLADRSRSRIGELSGGMYRRVLFAQAVLDEPRLLLLDEPTAGLDPEQRVRLRELIVGLPWLEAAVVSSHLMDDLTPIAERMVMLNDGALVFDGSVAELAALGGKADPGERTQYEAAFLRLREGRSM